MRKNAGITLIALVITVIVLLILAGISISMLTGDSSILSQAENATIETDVASIAEQIQIELLAIQAEGDGTYTEDDVLFAVQEVLGSEATIDEMANENGTGTIYTVTTTKGNIVDISDIMAGAQSDLEIISTETPYVGYYADIDGDKNVDGIIYADLLFSTTGSYSSVSYSYDSISDAKTYYISEKDYVGDYGTKDVITPVKGSGGNERFYIMSLNYFVSDDGTETFTWFSNAANSSAVSGLVDSITSVDFGKGYENTVAIIDAWTDSGYTSSSDVWGYIQDLVDEGWFVASAGEWATLYGECGFTSSYLKLTSSYFGYSSISSRFSAYLVLYNNIVTNSYYSRVDNAAYTYLSTIF